MSALPGLLALPGCDLRFADAPGREPAVVFLHGAGADHATFTEQAAALAQAGRRVVLLDLRGHGLSQPNSVTLTKDVLLDDIEALVAHLGLDRPILAGHSLGGNLAQALVRRTPEKYRALIAIDSTWNTGPLSALERFALRLTAPGLALVPARSLPSVMAKASAVTAGSRAVAERAFSQVSKRDFLQIWRATVSFVEPDPAYRTPVPLLLVRGAEDKTGNIATAMPAWAAAEGVSEYAVAGAGHLVTQDAPLVVDGILLDFLAHLDVR